MYSNSAHFPLPYIVFQSIISHFDILDLLYLQFKASIKLISVDFTLLEQ